MQLSVVVPVYNEGDLIAEFLQAVAAALKQWVSNFEIIAVDDGSRDDSAMYVKSVMEQLPVKLISFSRNFGKEKAITAGLQYTSGDAVLIIDSDFQHPFETIPDMLAKWQEGYDNVYGVREDRKDQRFFNRLFAKAFYRMNQHLMNIELPPDAGDFRLLDRKVVDALNLLPEANRFMKGLYAWVGFKGCPVVYEVKPRKAGKSRWSFFRLLDLAITGITSFSEWPLRIWSYIGLLISFIAFIYGLWVIIDTLAFGNAVPGWATLASGMMFLGGIQLLSIGIIGEYIGRIFNEVKRRPNFLIAEQYGFEKPDDVQK